MTMALKADSILKAFKSAVKEFAGVERQEFAEFLGKINPLIVTFAAQADEQQLGVCMVRCRQFLRNVQVDAIRAKDEAIASALAGVLSMALEAAVPG